MKSYFQMIIMLLVPVTVLSDSFPESTPKVITELWDQRISYLSSLGQDLSDRDCTRKWSKLTVDATLEMVVAMGYYEAEVMNELHAADQSFANTLVGYLTRPCLDAHYHACGFHEVSRSRLPEHFITYGFRELKKQGTDRFGKPLLFRLKIIHSSVHWLDKINRLDQRKLQDQKSQSALDEFYDGIRNADVVFYNGHARDGGGPDFFIPKLTSEHSTHVDYGWYRANKPMIKELIEQLENNETQIALLGLFACQTLPHFAKSIQQADPDLGLIGSFHVTPKNILELALMGAIDATIGQKCQKAFEESLHVSNQYRFQIKW